jgi:cysteine-rich repeat protein
MGVCRVALAIACVLAFAACKVPNASRVAPPLCGNGVLDPGEACDDGNTVGGDGCSADCLSDETCGNGIIDPGEQCDDGNTIACDGCSADCKSDETCGNGVIDRCKGETCDDGNTIGGDGCSANCQSNEKCGNGVVDTALGEECDGGGNQTATCELDCKKPRCGDGIKNTLAGEECDDGNNISGDGCDDKCRIEKCGNGRVEDNEQCDDGNQATNDACVNCRFATCGDFYVWTVPAPAHEQCDEGPTPSIHGACPAMCKRATCGDGYVWNTEGGTEQCDDGNAVNTDACPACHNARCGDGYQWITGCTGAQCEDCDSGGTDTATCNAGTCRTSMCGDNYPNAAAGEQCDLGAGNSDTGACTTSCHNAVCGDGLVYAGVEACDTGGTDTATCNGGTCTTPMCGDNYFNAAAGEECDEGLTPDPAGACPGFDTTSNVPTCVAASCGDGYVWTNNCGANCEQCDHGSANGTDGICGANCQCVVSFPCQ